MLARSLLKHLPSSLYDLEFRTAVAFRVPVSLRYEITDTHFIVPNLLPRNLRLEYALADYTCGSLASALTSHEILIDEINQQTASLSAEMLRAKSIDDNRTAVELIDDVIPCLFHTASKALSHADQQLINMMFQLVLTDSKGEWCDVWGTYFDVPRASGEDDIQYTRRIVSEVFQPRSNRYAIERILEFVSRKLATVFEPWTKLLKLDSQSVLDEHILYDGHYWSYATIDIKSDASITEIIRVGNRNRAAGVKLFLTQGEQCDVSETEIYQNDTTQWLISYMLDPSLSYEIVLDSTGYVDGWLEHYNHPLQWLMIYDPSTVIIIDPVFDDEGKKYHPAATGGNMPFPTYYFAHSYNDKTTLDKPITLYTSSDFTIDELSEWGYYCSAEQVFLLPVPKQAREFDITFRKLLDLSGRHRKLKNGSYRLVSDGGMRYITN